MNKKEIILTISTLSLAAAAVGTFIYFKKRSKTKTEVEDYGDTEKEIKKIGGELGVPDESEYSKKDKITGSKELKIGAKGRRIAVLQALLNHYKGSNLKIDGAFGNATRVALLKNGYMSCVISATCEVSPTDYLELLKKAKTDTSFKKKYALNNNAEMNAVYSKYSS